MMASTIGDYLSFDPKAKEKNRFFIKCLDHSIPTPSLLTRQYRTGGEKGNSRNLHSGVMPFDQTQLAAPMIWIPLYAFICYSSQLDKRVPPDFVSDMFQDLSDARNSYTSIQFH